ncbi:phage major capsid protein, partial [Citrobacter portucalensis]
MKKLLELRQQKAEIKTQLRNLLEKADREKRNLTDEEGTQFDELRTRAGTLDTE